MARRKRSQKNPACAAVRLALMRAGFSARKFKCSERRIKIGKMRLKSLDLKGVLHVRTD